MVNQTSENDENNSGKQSKKDLENEIRSTWLGLRSWNRTFMPEEMSTSMRSVNSSIAIRSPLRE